MGFLRGLPLIHCFAGFFQKPRVFPLFPKATYLERDEHGDLALAGEDVLPEDVERGNFHLDGLAVEALLANIVELALQERSNLGEGNLRETPALGGDETSIVIPARDA